MNEFKFACPWCRQHMMCDMSQRGTVMQCPTCFQKVGAPMVPSPDAKYILTGTKIQEKKSADVSDADSDGAEKKFPAAILVGVIALALLAAGAGFFFLRAKKTVNPPVAVAGWQKSDIGNVGVAGSFSLAKGVFTVSGTGVDIWNEADSFHFVFQALNGNGTLTAHLLKIKNTDTWAKAGVMFRDSLDANSAYAVAFATPASGIAFQRRDHSAGQSSEVLHIPNLAAPCWLRLVRQGNSVTAASSLDGTSWTTMGSATIPMVGNQTYAGLAVCSHKNETLCQAQFDNVTLRTDVIVVKVITNAAPAPVPAPKTIVPVANDTNWTMTLTEAVTPNAPAVGRIHGQDFKIDRATFQNGTLTLWSGGSGTSVLIIFGNVQPQAVSRKTINVSTDAEKAAPVQLRWRDDTGAQRKIFNSGYALRLEFGAVVNNRLLPGRIYLCTPDPEKSYLIGNFTAIIPSPKPKLPGPAPVKKP